MSQSLTVIRPLDVQPDMLVSSSVPETDYPEWSASTTYDEGQRCIVAARHKVYQSTAAGNVGNDPSAAISIKWVEVGATNRWKSFDKSVSTQTRKADAISYRLKPGAAITSINVLNISGGTSLRVRVVAPGDVAVYDKTVALGRVLQVAGWWQWFFGERRTPTQVLLSALPSYSTADILIDITGTADLGVGVILMGQARAFGLGVRMGARVGIQDYSTKGRNDFGDVIVVQRAFAKRANVSMLLPAGEVDVLHTFLADVRATPCLWICTTSYESLAIYGFYKNFDIVIAYAMYSDCDIEIEGLT